MEPIPARLMRAQVAACKNRPAPTPRESARRAYIIEAARNIFIAHGRLRVTLNDVAIASGLTQNSIRNQIADLDHLFAITLTKHLDDILTAIAAVPSHHPDLLARRRAEYLRVTRGLFNIPTPMHFLLMHERFTLPEDELEPVEARRRTLGFMLAGEAWETALLLLDSHHLDAPEIEHMLQAFAAAPEAPPEAIEEPDPLLNLVAAKETPAPQASASYDITLRTTPASFFRVVNAPQVNNSE